METIATIPAGQGKIYIDALCPKCKTAYTGTLRKMQPTSEKKN
jgi:phage FluMu protein Com